MKKAITSLIFVLIIFQAFSQVTIDWKSNVEFYSHGSANNASVSPPIDFVLHDSKIFTLTQNGVLSCISKSTGEILWKRKVISGVFITGGGNIKLNRDNEIIITVANKIKKYSIVGKLIWEERIKFLGKKYFVNSIYVSEDNSILITSNIRDKFSRPASKSFLLKYDNDGGFVWRRLLSKDEESDDYHPRKKILEINQNIFVFGNIRDHQNHIYRTIIYKFSKKGKLLKKYSFNGYTNAMYMKDNSLYSLSGKGNYSSENISIIKFTDELEIKDKIEILLPLNGFYRKENYKLDSLNNKLQTYYTKIPARIYKASDFLLDVDNNFIIAGSSNKKLWVLKLVNKGIEFDWSIDYINNNDEYPRQSYQMFNRIQFEKDSFYLSGITNSKGDFHTDWIKLFIFKINETSK